MSRNKSPFMTIGLIILAVLLIGLIIWALTLTDDEPVTTNTTEPDTAAVEEDESLFTQVVDNPAAFVDQEVTLEAEVQDVLSDRVIKIFNDTIGDELTVLLSNPLTTEQAEQAELFLADNASVQVTGTVRQATVAEFERDYVFSVDPELEAEFENRAVLVADSIVFTEQGGEEWTLRPIEWKFH